MPNFDLCDDLALSEEELDSNKMSIEVDQAMTFSPDFTLLNIETGFRIFASSESLNEILTKKYKIHETCRI
jgi:hypothetical protein